MCFYVAMIIFILQVLILEPNKVYVPSYLQVNLDEENKVRLWTFI